MFFKNIRFYRLNPNNLPEKQDMEQYLAQQSFTPPLNLDIYSAGFVPVHGFSDDLLFAAKDTWSIALKVAEKALTANIINEALNEKISKIETQEARKLGRKERIELKDEVIDDLLPKALFSSHRTLALCNHQQSLLFINQSSKSKAERLLKGLREAMGGLDAKLPNTQCLPSTLMTEWLQKGECDGRFELGDEVALKGNGDVAAMIKISKQDLRADEVVQHLQSGKRVIQMGLVWRNWIAFVLNEDFTLKHIHFLDGVHHQAQDTSEDPQTFAMASQIIAADALTEMIEELADLLGGWQPD